MTRKYRYQFLGIWMIVLTVLIVMLDVSVYLHYTQMWETTPHNADFITRLAYEKWFAVLSMAVLSIVLLSTMASMALFSGHRIGGPFLALKRTMQEVREGNFDARLHFRDYDRMDDVQDLFNEMMEVVQQEIQSNEEKTELELTA